MMYKIGEAISELVKAGSPLIGRYIWMYYAYSLFDDLLGCGTVLTIVYVAYRLVSRWQDAEFGDPREKP